MSRAGANPVALHPRDHRQPGEHARRAVVIAAARHRIEMAAEHDPLRRPIRPRQGHVEVARGIDVGFQTQPLGGGAHEIVRRLLAGAIGVPRDADAVETAFVQSLEQASGEGDIGGEVGAHLHSPRIRSGWRATRPSATRPAWP